MRYRGGGKIAGFDDTYPKDSRSRGPCNGVWHLGEPCQWLSVERWPLGDISINPLEAYYDTTICGAKLITPTVLSNYGYYFPTWLRSVDGGVTWYLVADDTYHDAPDPVGIAGSANLQLKGQTRNVRYKAPTDVYVATSSNGVGVSTNSGQTFTASSSPVPSSVRGIQYRGGKLYASTSDGVWVRDTAGSWSSYGLSGTSVLSVHKGGGKLIAGTDGQGAKLSGDGGHTWTTWNSDTFNPSVTSNPGIDNNIVRSVLAIGGTLYVGTNTGLNIGTVQTGSVSYSFKRPIASTVVYGVFVEILTSGVHAIYAATSSGVRVSTDGGTLWILYGSGDGLGSSTVYGIHKRGSKVYAATAAGLSIGLIADDGPITWYNKTASANGLGSNTVYSAYATASRVYAATEGGLSVSTNGGQTFSNVSSLGAVRGVSDNDNEEIETTPDSGGFPNDGTLYALYASAGRKFVFSNVTELWNDNVLVNFTTDPGDAFLTQPVQVIGSVDLQAEATADGEEHGLNYTSKLSYVWQYARPSYVSTYDSVTGDYVVTHGPPDEDQWIDYIPPSSPGSDSGANVTFTPIPGLTGIVYIRVKAVFSYWSGGCDQTFARPKILSQNPRTLTPEYINRPDSVAYSDYVILEVP